MKTILLTLAYLLSNQLYAQDLNTLFSESGDLTDKQAKESKEFVHQGIKDQIYSDGCKDLQNCAADEDNGGIEKIIGQVYATALPLVLNQIPTGSKKVATPEAKSTTEVANLDNDVAQTTAKQNKKTEKEEGTDWCMIGAMGYEMVSMAMQNKLQQKGSKSEASIPDAQLRTLVNLKETHKARKKSATYQATAYGLVTTCYAVSLATGQQSFNWKLGVKMAGSTLLTTLYMKKAKKHDRLAGKVQKVIDALPKTGECNPWTQSACFCNEATSKNIYPAEYQEVCVLNNGNFDTPLAEIGCASQASDGTVSYDEQCQCKKTNSCLQVKVSAINPNVSGAANLMSQMQSGYDLLNSGLYDEAKLNAYSTQAAAMGSKISRQIKNPNPETIHLTAEQKAVAKDLAGLVTPEIAAKVASAKPEYPENSIAGGASLGKAQLSDKAKTEQARIGGVKTQYKSSSTNSNSARSNEPGFVMPNLLAKKESASASTEVINFAQKAIENADVSNAPETPIFDIISNRYRHTWKRLDGSAQLD